MGPGYMEVEVPVKGYPGLAGVAQWFSPMNQEVTV